MAPSRCNPPLSQLPRANTSASWGTSPAPVSSHQSSASSPPIASATQGAKRAMRSKRGLIPGGSGSTL